MASNWYGRGTIGSILLSTVRTLLVEEEHEEDDDDVDGVGIYFLYWIWEIEGKLGTDESEFVRILASRGFLQLRATFEAYNRIADKDIVSSIKSETSGVLEDALVAIGFICV